MQECKSLVIKEMNIFGKKKQIWLVILSIDQIYFGIEEILKNKLR